MKVKRYYSVSPYEAFKQIRAELGADAVILYSQKVRRGGWLGYLKGPVYEIGVAVDVPEEYSVAPTVSRPSGGEAAPVRERRGQPTLPLPELSDVKQSIAFMQEELSRLGGTSGQQKRPPARSPHVQRIEEQLLSAGLNAELVRELTNELRFELSRKALQSGDAVSQAMRGKLESNLPVADTDWPLKGGPATVFVVGPTGVGKTSTVAKLAARYSSLGAQSIHLATLDTHRVGAIPQLQAYADILDIPLEIVYTPSEFRKVISTRSAGDVTIVDTPGVVRKNWKSLAELAEYVNVVDDAAVYLALNASMRDEEAVRTVEDFGVVPVHGLVITKADESDNIGFGYNAAWRSAKPLVYFTTGQSVPEDIELANASIVVKRLLGAQ